MSRGSRYTTQAMDWLPRLILLTGTGMAATMGFALAALLVRSALGKLSRSSDLSAQEASDFLSEESTEAPLMMRGYDTPELWREDALLRGEHSGAKYIH